jgi:hypothetical protein
LDASLACSGPTGNAGVSITLTVPANAQAVVRVPFPAAASAGGIVVTEGAATVWAAGAFVPGTPGVLSASLVTAATPNADLPVGQQTVDILVGAGAFSFASAY